MVERWKLVVFFYIVSVGCRWAGADHAFVRENANGRSPIRTNKPREVLSEFCDYLPGVKLSDQDSLNLCSFHQLARLSGQWVRRHNNCNWKAWYNTLDPMGVSTVYQMNTTGTKFMCGAAQKMKNIVGNRHRFSPSGCSLLRFNPGHAAEMVNNPCLSPVLFLGDKMVENLAMAWKSLVDVKEGEIEYRHLSSLEPLNWLQSVQRFKTIIIAPDWEPLSEWENEASYANKVDPLVTQINERFHGRVVLFVGPNSRKCPKASTRAEMAMPLPAQEIWERAFHSHNSAKLKFFLFNVGNFSVSWPGAFPPSSTRDRCVWCLPGLPDTWAQILFTLLHKEYINCQIEEFNVRSKSIPLHDALYAAMPSQ